MEVAGYINGNIEGVEVQVLRNIGGQVFQVHWVSRYASLASYEQHWKGLEADEGYQAQITKARAAGLFIGSSIVDRLYEVL